jgi:hypothetical protein
MNASFSYDGNGQRVSKTVNGTTTTYVYDASGQLAAEYGSTPATCQTCYLMVDSLGSTRVVTDQTATVIGRHDYLPFGEDIPSTWGSRNSIPGYSTAYNTAAMSRKNSPPKKEMPKPDWITSGRDTCRPHREGLRARTRRSSPNERSRIRKSGTSTPMC